MMGKTPDARVAQQTDITPAHCQRKWSLTLLYHSCLWKVEPMMGEINKATTHKDLSST